jgi:hypothetical protein
LSCRQAAPGTATPGKQEITSFPTSHAQIVIKGQTRLLSQFKTNGSAGLLLSGCRTIESVAIRRHVIDPDRHDITSAQLAVDSKVEQREVARAFFDVQFSSDRPDMARSQRRLLRDNLDETGASIWMRRGGRVV